MDSYVLNNPLPAIDPLGLECVWDDGSFDSANDPVTGSYGGCNAAGGTWFDHDWFVEQNLGDWSSNPNNDLAGLVGISQNGAPDVIVYGNVSDVNAISSWDWWGAFASNLFSWQNAKQAQINAWNKGYYKCLGKKTAGGATAPVVTQLWVWRRQMPPRAEHRELLALTIISQTHDLLLGESIPKSWYQI